MSASGSALRRLTNRSPRTLGASRFAAPSSLLRCRASIVPNTLKNLQSTTPRVARFSTMAPLQSTAPAPSVEREYDPEIKDMADYVHNYKIESDLAVWIASWYFLLPLNVTF